MEVEKKRAIFFGSILALIVIISVVYFVWGSVINRGTIFITGKAPFNVEIYEGPEFACETSPCEIKTTIGEKDLLISKEGYLTGTFSVDVPLWRTVLLEANLTMEPVIEEVTEIPEVEEIPAYKLVYDKEKGMQKLVSTEDPLGVALTYLPRSIEKPKIFGSKNAVLIIEETYYPRIAYKINLSTKTREKITGTEFKGIKDGKFSYDGKNFAFSTDSGSKLFLIDSLNNIKTLDVANDLTRTAWGFDNNLIFVEVSGQYFTFNEFIPTEDSYIKIAQIPISEEYPENLVPVISGTSIYFSIGVKNYRIKLR